MTDYSPGQRAAAYWFSDGFRDLFLGTILIVFAGVAVLWQSIAPHPWIYDFGLISGGFLLHVVSERRVLEFLKSHTTWRRTGYVRPPEESMIRPEFTTLAISSSAPNENVSHFLRRTVQIVFCGLFCLFSASPIPPWLPAAVLASLAIALYFATRRTEHPYTIWWTAALAASGVIFLAVNLASRVEALLCFVIAGIWFLAHGAVAHVRYLQENS